ncbi:hypothetical protein TUM20985_09560 [Mycobacterium antarcticum]|uniref:hypothetical protein n=1 Tax=unclassified Mycolicibacterium TaxID=2636767 RepID=UPI00239B2AB0|nr:MULTISPECIES: hypothetical protein [unclassified Mycolicibacterium]BDX30409.1 hypothetical protein TUM20985_09560 [Mycolicibacterium sp. TUM20985]GLP73849.1 hypothetical protein TUM20983_09590 [Mycolicibacterium sp. TUM20983]GLP79533.1 hypothetical protein TUM20984_09530 [Mycolicibacterium sp. TUM20984]
MRPTARTRTSTSPGPGSGTGTSSFRAPLFYRLVTTGDPINEQLIQHAANVALAAARAGLLTTPQRSGG